MLVPGLVAAVSSPVLLIGYAYAGYPALLRLGSRRRREPRTSAAAAELPHVSVTLPAYNEERRLASALDAILGSGYPADRLQLLVISDASTDATDDIARGYAERGVELLRLPSRQGKTAGENASRAVVRGDIVITTDASVRVLPGALGALAAAFADPTVGVASGCDISVSSEQAGQVQGEGSYVDFEMALRDLETRHYGIVGASGCLFAIRRELHAVALPDTLSRDFASALVAQEHGFRSVSVPEAKVLVPRAGALGAEYRRKVRTMARGLRTLWFKRHLLNPLRHGFFAFALWSHKVARWLVYPASLAAVLALGVLALDFALARWLLALAGAGVLAGVLAWRAAERGARNRVVRMIGFAFAANVAGLAAWREFMRGTPMAVWEPTRRPE